MEMAIKIRVRDFIAIRRHDLRTGRRQTSVRRIRAAKPQSCRVDTRKQTYFLGYLEYFIYLFIYLHTEAGASCLKNI